MDDFCRQCCDNGYYYTCNTNLPYDPFTAEFKAYGGIANASLRICGCQAGARFIRAKRIERIYERDMNKKDLSAIYKKKLRDLLAIKKEYFLENND